MVTSAADDRTIIQMKNLVGDAHVFTWETMDDYWKSQITAAIAPNSAVACLVFPTTAEELAAVINHAHHHQIPILPCGNGSKLDWGGLVRQSSHSPLPTPHSPFLVVSTSRLNKLIDHAVGDLTVTVEAGMKFAELQATLAKAGQFLAIDPAYPAQATIGGIVATADTGSLRQRYNSVRDMLLGVSFVRADGEMAKAGGRVVKNVAGYDLMKLFTGSYGTLGVLTQFTFRVYPLSAASQTVILTGDAAAIAQLTQTILPSTLTPTRLDLLSASLMQQLELGTEVGIAMQLQSIAASVEEQISKVVELGHTLQLLTAVYKNGDDVTVWQRLQEYMTPTPKAGAITCKIGIQPAQAMVLLQAAQSLLANSLIQIHASTGVGRLWVDADEVDRDRLLQLRAICQEHQGFLTLLAAPPTWKQELDVWGYSGNGLEVMRRIKHQFDPNHRLSPHRFVGGI